jgi:ferredoxin
MAKEEDSVKVRADRSRCKGHGLCFVVDQDLFPLDDGHIAIEGDMPVPPGREEYARNGVESCPEMALEIVDD